MAEIGGQSCLRHTPPRSGDGVDGQARQLAEEGRIAGGQALPLLREAATYDQFSGHIVSKTWSRSIWFRRRPI
jgi:hypothetical protein